MFKIDPTHLNSWIVHYVDVVLVFPVDLGHGVTHRVTGEGNVPLDGGNGYRTPG